jgi:DNA mismatch repair ATPase MutS
MLKEFVLKKAGVMSVVVFQLFMWSVYAFTMGYFYKLFYLSAFLILYFLYLKLTNRQKINA